MILWLIIAALGVLAAVALGWGPRVRWPGAAADSSAAQIEIYKAQLTEIESDLSRGVLAPGEAEGQRSEVARRLLAVVSSDQAKTASVAPWLGVTSACFVPLLAFAIYVQVGAPVLPDLPQATRLAQAEANGDLEAMVYKVEKHLAKNPDDAAGWEIVIPSYKSMGRFGDVAQAYRRLIAIRSGSADLYAELSEALMFAGNGLMPKEGAAAAVEALKLDPAHTKARYYHALALAQDGDVGRARQIFEALLAAAAADAPHRASVERELANLNATSAKAPQLTDEQLALGQGQTSGEQQQMIKGMVDGLAEKLKTDPKNLEGWLRLIRARVVLKEVEVAKLTLIEARSAFVEDVAALAKLDGLAKDLNLQ